MRGKPQKDSIRRRLAVEAARIMVEQGIGDYGRAREKALSRLGRVSIRHLPDNEEIEDALQEYQRIFLPQRQPQLINRLLHVAVAAMESLAQFEPRLVGPVWWGTAGADSPVQLHLFAETGEEVALFLLERRIPHRQSEQVVRLGRRELRVPVYRFNAGDTKIELKVFGRSGSRQAPPSRKDGRPEKRVPISQVRERLRELEEGA
jgi:hypothetical protein